MSSDRYLTSITKLNGEIYHDWKFAVNMALRQKGCWGVISGVEVKSTTRDGDKAWEAKAEEGLTIIALTVDPSQYTYIWNSKNGVEAWTALKDTYEKNSRSMRISLKRQFYAFEHNTNAPMTTYVNGITDLAGKLKAIGITLTDEEITDVLIYNLDNEYSVEKVVRVVVKVKQINCVTCDISWVCDYETTRLPLSNIFIHCSITHSLQRRSQSFRSHQCSH